MDGKIIDFVARKREIEARTDGIQSEVSQPNRVGIGIYLNDFGYHLVCHEMDYDVTVETGAVAIGQLREFGLPLHELCEGLEMAFPIEGLGFNRDPLEGQLYSDPAVSEVTYKLWPNDPERGKMGSTAEEANEVLNAMSEIYGNIENDFNYTT